MLNRVQRVAIFLRRPIHARVHFLFEFIEFINRLLLESREVDLVFFGFVGEELADLRLINRQSLFVKMRVALTLKLAGPTGGTKGRLRPEEKSYSKREFWLMTSSFFWVNWIFIKK